MSEHFLYETLDILRDAKVNLDLPEIIETGLSKNIILREYQIDAFKNFVTYFENDNLRYRLWKRFERAQRNTR